MKIVMFYRHVLNKKQYSFETLPFVVGKKKYPGIATCDTIPIYKHNGGTGCSR